MIYVLNGLNLTLWMLCILQIGLNRYEQQSTLKITEDEDDASTSNHTKGG